ncbi:LOW QUALITY PROTEIN: hypothetical protein Cgig2_008766 [Carnegiea gigantea]|uniref:Transposase-associated domain-containing protein n=1 Tax=Carnegiea gigantea TaxID=171969 RepID=A0A9Q1QCP6_9CARY|nr:LOW QUALITY PROTEIN: hypothetical protein Cgig2_008766 [Carnegiea gigantea]
MGWKLKYLKYLHAQIDSEMDSSWIELPNDHPDYLDGAVKFIKLAKENPAEGRTRCPCRRCKVDKWLPIEEVEQHILFKGFYEEYKHFIFHGKGDILDHVKHRGSTSPDTNNDLPNIVGQDDMEGSLRVAFGVDILGSGNDILHDVVDKPLNEGVEPLDITARAQLAMRLDLKPPIQPSPSMTPTEPLVQKPPDLVPATQPHKPITSPASEQASKQPSIKHAEPTAASVPIIEQPHV